MAGRIFFLWQVGYNRDFIIKTSIYNKDRKRFFSGLLEVVFIGLINSYYISKLSVIISKLSVIGLVSDVSYQ